MPSYPFSNWDKVKETNFLSIFVNIVKFLVRPSLSISLTNLA